ncbi:MAG: aspartokinase/homoserine dehydrogenase 1, partial [Enterobacterales bacterium]
MKILKFGGSSLKNADRFLHVAKIVDDYSQKSQVATVLSAPKGITNDLITLTDGLETLNEDNLIAQQNCIEQKLLKILDDVFNECS